MAVLARDAAKLPPCGFVVSGGRKGALPISVEKRAKGKKVTVISNVQGSAKSLLSALSSLLGCGGTLRQESSGVHWTVEVQGDQAERVSAALVQLGCLRGVQKDIGAKEKKNNVEIATRVCAYDKFLRRGEPERGEAVAASAALAASYAVCPFLDADCTQWHGPWIYCRGRCIQTDLNNVWEEAFGAQETVVREPLRPSPSMSTDHLDIMLRGIGMLAEAGSATQRIVPARQVDEETLRPRHALVTSVRGSVKGRGVATGRVRSCGSGQVSRSSRAPGPLAKPKEGNFLCPACGCRFGLQKTLRLHVKGAHPGLVMGALSRRAPVQAVSANTCPCGSINLNDSSGFCRKCGIHGSKLSASTATSSLEIQLNAAKTCACGSVFLNESAKFCRKCGKRRSECRQSSDKEVREPRLSPCPVCSELFPPDVIEDHVEACLKASDVQLGDDSSSEDASVHDVDTIEAGDVCVAIEDHEQGGPGLAEQLKICCGDLVIVEWTQPGAEGGFWAYVRQEACPELAGHVPLSSLQRCNSSDRHRDANTACGAQTSASLSTHASAEASLEEHAVIPAEWLESFLILNLSRECADAFWQQFECLQHQKMPLDKAWLLAFESVAPSGVKSTSHKNTFVAEAPRPRSGDRSDAAEAFPPLVSAPHASMVSPCTTPAPVEVPDVGGGVGAWRRNRIARDSDCGWVHVPQAKDNLQDMARSSSGCGGLNGNSNGWATSENSWDMHGDRRGKQKVSWHDDALEVACGASRDSWVDNNREDRWGRSENSWDEKDCVWVTTQCSSDMNDNSWGIREDDMGMDAARNNGSGRKDIGPRAWRRRRNAKESAESFPPLQHAPSCQARAVGAVAADSQQKPARFLSVAMSVCPVCGAEVASTAIEAHVDCCLGAADAAAMEPSRGVETTNGSIGRKGGVDTPPPFCLDAGERCWAEAQLGALARRFCLSHLDAAVALAALCVCTSAEEMCFEAIILLCDNAPVRNFAAELWRRSNAPASRARAR